MLAGLRRLVRELERSRPPAGPDDGERARWDRYADSCPCGVEVGTCRDHPRARREPVQGGAHRLDHGPEAGLGVLHLGGVDSDAAVEVGEHPLGPGLGTIDADDAEMLRPDGLDSGSDHPARLVDGLGRGRGASFPGLESTSHEKGLLVRVWGADRLPTGSLHGSES